MRKYDKAFKEEAVKLSDEAGIKQVATQLGVAYYTLSEWRHTSIMLLLAAEFVAMRR